MDILIGIVTNVAVVVVFAFLAEIIFAETENADNLETNKI